MIHHCTRFTVKPEVSEEDIAAALVSMREHGAADPNIEFSVVGQVLGGELQYGVVSGIKDIEAYAEMMNDPAHLERDRSHG